MGPRRKQNSSARCNESRIAAVVAAVFIYDTHRQLHRVGRRRTRFPTSRIAVHEKERKAAAAAARRDARRGRGFDCRHEKRDVGGKYTYTRIFTTRFARSNLFLLKRF